MNIYIYFFLFCFVFVFVVVVFFFGIKQTNLQNSDMHVRL